jgi:hypothetical protein
VGCLYAHPNDGDSPPDEPPQDDVGAAAASATSALVPAPVAAAAPLTFAERLELFFNALAAVSATHAASDSEAQAAAQLLKIPTMLARYEGREQQLFDALAAKHGVSVPGPQRPLGPAGWSDPLEDPLAAVRSEAGSAVAYAPPPPYVPPAPPPLPPPDAVPQVWPTRAKAPGGSGLGSGLGSSAALAATFVPGRSGGGGSGVRHDEGAGDAADDAAATASTAAAAGTLARVRSVPIPQHLWTADVARDPAAFAQVKTRLGQPPNVRPPFCAGAAIARALVGGPTVHLSFSFFGWGV